MSASEGDSSAWKIVLLFEALALMIALILPFSPSKTGSDTELADHLLADPTYAEKVALYFALLNVVLLCIWMVYLFRGGLTQRKSDDIEA